MSSGLAQHNAHLTAIAGGGFSEDYDQAAGSDAARWSGQVEAYVSEKVLEQVGADGLDQLKETQLLMPATVGVVPDVDDSVTYTVNGTTFVRTVRQVEDHSTVGFLRLRFWDA